jgi:hypothetical protein
VAVASRLVDVAGGVAADRDLDGGVDVARREAVARRTCAIASSSESTTLTDSFNARNSVA